MGAKRSSDQSLPLLVCHTRYPTKMMMMIMRSVCVVVKTSEEVVVIETNIVECADKVKMSKQKMKTKSEIMMLLLHHLKRKPFNLLPLLDVKVFRLEIS